MRDTLHDASVTDQHVSVVIDDFKPFEIEHAAKLALSHHYAFRVRQTMVEQTWGRFDA